MQCRAAGVKTYGSTTESELRHPCSQSARDHGVTDDLSAQLLIDLALALGAQPAAVQPQPSSSGFIRGESGVAVGAPATAALHQCAIDPAAFGEHLWAALSVPCPAGLAKAVAKRRSEFLAGRYCVRRALEAIGIVGVSVERGEGGCPVWPTSVQGSVSHHDGVAIAAVTVAPGVLGVGIDVQTIVPAKTIADISSSILHGYDATLMATQRQPELAFTLIFSIKESFFKAAFPSVRRYFDFDAAEIVELDLEAGRFRLRLRESLDDGLLKAGATFDGRMAADQGRVMSLLVFEDPAA